MRERESEREREREKEREEEEEEEEEEELVSQIQKYRIIDLNVEIRNGKTYINNRYQQVRKGKQQRHCHL